MMILQKRADAGSNSNGVNCSELLSTSHRCFGNDLVAQRRRCGKNILDILTFASLLICFLTSAGSADAKYAHTLFYETVRTSGMGGACVAVADDQQALHCNPAGLCQVKDKAYAPISANAEINQDFRRVKNKTDGLSDNDTPEARTANNQILSSIMGQRARSVMSNLAYYLGGTGYGAAFLYQAAAETRVIRPTSPRIQAIGDVDSVLSGSISRPVPGTRIAFNDKAEGWWGATLKFLSRRSIDKEFDARDFAGLSENDLRSNEFKGATFDFDGGTFWKLKNKWNSTIGLFVANLFESEIDPSIGRLRRVVSLGTTIRPLKGENAQKLMLAADYWDLGGSGSEMSKRRLGMEFQALKWLKLRGGIRGGYLSAGCTATFREARLEFATYSEEVGPRPGDREDRRYSVSLGIEF